jgi:hypothetical protein
MVSRSVVECENGFRAVRVEGLDVRPGLDYLLNSDVSNQVPYLDHRGVINDEIRSNKRWRRWKRKVQRSVFKDSHIRSDSEGCKSGKLTEALRVLLPVEEQVGLDALPGAADQETEFCDCKEAATNVSSLFSLMIFRTKIL